MTGRGGDTEMERDGLEEMGKKGKVDRWMSGWMDGWMDGERQR
jgi:hypothetical protein